jgi:hypothetical protein
MTILLMIGFVAVWNTNEEILAFSKNSMFSKPFKEILQSV